MSKKYQVFISSTYNDLVEERKAVEETIIRMGDIPVGMESFPAADEEQFSFIKTIIDTCDYYVLIIAGRYGSVDEQGLSYTEKEFHYALSIGLPVLVFPFANIDRLEAGKVEASESKRAALANFTALATGKRMRRSWETIDGLKLAVREALDYAKATKPRPGWVRGDSPLSPEVTEELLSLRRKNEVLQSQIGKFSDLIALPSLPDAESTVRIAVSRGGTTFARSTRALIEGSWIDFLGPFAMGLRVSSSYNDGEYYFYVDERNSVDGIGCHIVSLMLGEPVNDASISSADLKRLSSYFIELGVMREDGHDEILTASARKLARRSLVAEPQVRSRFKVIEGTLDDDIPF